MPSCRLLFCLFFFLFLPVASSAAARLAWDEWSGTEGAREEPAEEETEGRSAGESCGGKVVVVVPCVDRSGEREAERLVCRERLPFLRGSEAW